MLLQGVTAAAGSAAITYHDTHDVVGALEAARAATHVIIAACTVSGEGALARRRSCDLSSGL